MTTRMYATIRVRVGDYLIPSNDRSTAYRIHRCEGEGWDVSTRPIIDYDGWDVDAFLDHAAWSTQSTHHRTKRDAIDSIVW